MSVWKKVLLSKGVIYSTGKYLIAKCVVPSGAFVIKEVLIMKRVKLKLMFFCCRDDRRHEITTSGAETSEP